MRTGEAWGGRFPANEIISLLDNFPVHNLGESTSQDLLLGELLDLIGPDELRGLRLGYVSAQGGVALRERISSVIGMAASPAQTSSEISSTLSTAPFTKAT